MRAKKSSQQRSVQVVNNEGGGTRTQVNGFFPEGGCTKHFSIVNFSNSSHTTYAQFLIFLNKH